MRLRCDIKREEVDSQRRLDRDSDSRKPTVRSDYRQVPRVTVSL